MSIDAPNPAADTSLKVLALRRPGTCACGSALAVGEQAAWDRATRAVWCLPCARSVLAGAAATPPSTEPASIELGVAGGSAQQEFDRRHSKREDRIREAHPRLGGLILALSDHPQSTRAWQSGARGERKLGEKLASLGDSVIALHDRQVPKTRANIDHIVIGPAGVYVIDAKRYRNAKIAVRRSGGFLSPVRTQLMVSGRDNTKLVEAMNWQIAAVRAALSNSAEFPDVRSSQRCASSTPSSRSSKPSRSTKYAYTARRNGQAGLGRGPSRRRSETAARFTCRRPAARETLMRFCSALVDLRNTERDTRLALFLLCYSFLERAKQL